MRPFVFRAQAALDLRRRRHDDAKRALAAANGAVLDAEAALRASVEQRNRALEAAREAEARATDVVASEWYRNWILSRKRDVAARQHELAERRTVEDAARARATRTHMDVRVLEKLEDRARRAYDEALRREEQKAIDWLAVLRSYTRPGGQGDGE